MPWHQHALIFQHPHQFYGHTETRRRVVLTFVLGDNRNVSWERIWYKFMDTCQTSTKTCCVKVLKVIIEKLSLLNIIRKHKYWWIVGEWWYQLQNDDRDRDVFWNNQQIAGWWLLVLIGRVHKWAYEEEEKLVKNCQNCSKVCVEWHLIYLLVVDFNM